MSNIGPHNEFEEKLQKFSSAYECQENEFEEKFSNIFITLVSVKHWTSQWVSSNSFRLYECQALDFIVGFLNSIHPN